MRSTASRGGASSSCVGTTSRIWSIRSKPRRTSLTRTPSAASGWARRASGWCLQRLAPSQANLERLSELIAANERDERCELMWGSPGTILAGRELGLDVTASIEWLRGQRDADGLWTQHLYGRSSRILGPAHGFAGCALALGDSRRRLGDAPKPFAVEEDGLVNWPPIAGMTRSTQTATARSACSGATARRGSSQRSVDMLDEDLAVAGGELTWRAGPLRKGANLCHGTAGNGYAFLALLERTGDERWLTPSARVRDARRRSGGAQPVGVRARPLHALDGRPRHGPLPRRLHRRRRAASPPLADDFAGSGQS